MSGLKYNFNYKAICFLLALMIVEPPALSEDPCKAVFNSSGGIRKSIIKVIPNLSEAEFSDSDIINFIKKIGGENVQEAIWSLYDKGYEKAATKISDFLEKTISNSKKKKFIKKLYTDGEKDPTAPDLYELDYGLMGVFSQEILHGPGCWATCWQNETAMYILDKRIKFNLVPITVEAEVNEKKGSMQLYTKIKAASEITEKDRKRMMASSSLLHLDYLAQSTDRSYSRGSHKNIGITESGRIVAYDNSLTFGVKGRVRRNDIFPPDVIIDPERLDKLFYLVKNPPEDIKKLLMDVVKETKSSASGKFNEDPQPVAYKFFSEIYFSNSDHTTTFTSLMLRIEKSIHRSLKLKKAKGIPLTNMEKEILTFIHHGKKRY